ncbi:MAG: hypothetical protein IPJ65_41780 [Archangiaceae bacterium]|nr:hypothetical protein [Archangiaceae bacterium]
MAALTAAKTRLEIQRDAFADPDATLAYLNSQLTAVEAVSAASKPVAAASLDDQVIVGDVVPPRARPAAVPSTGPSMLERLGATAAEVARAQALGVSPEALAYLLVEPPKKPAIFDGDVAPHNTAAEVIAAVEQGTPLAVLIAHHDEWVPVAEVAKLLEVEMPPHEYRQYRRYVDGPWPCSCGRPGTTATPPRPPRSSSRR